MKEKIDEGRRRFLFNATGFVGSIGALCAAIPFISSWMPSAKARAMGAPVEVDLSKLEPGQLATIEWRGKPVWILRRTQAMLDALAHSSEGLRDPNCYVDQQPSYTKAPYRSLNPEFLVLVGICTHLGCAPKYKPDSGDLAPDWPGGFYCPCHGSKFDLSGRVYKGVPAPINLKVPPHRFVNQNTLIVGEDPA